MSNARDLADLGKSAEAIDVDASAPADSLNVDSSGKVGIGTSSPIRNLHVEETNTPPMRVRRNTSDGSLVEFYKDTSTVGSIGAYDGRPYLASTTVGIRVSNALFPSNTGGVITDGTMNIGGSSGRFQDLYLSGGVYVGGTGSANYLDDYEEGTWTPSIVGSTTAGSYSTGTVVGLYTKIGNLVHLQGIFEGSSGTGSGRLYLQGLPFSITNVSNFVTGNIQANSNLDFPTGTITAPWFSVSSSAFGVRCTKDNTGYEYLDYPPTASFIRFSITYFTTD